MYPLQCSLQDIKITLKSKIRNTLWKLNLPLTVYVFVRLTGLYWNKHYIITYILTSWRSPDSSAAFSCCSVAISVSMFSCCRWKAWVMWAIQWALSRNFLLYSVFLKYEKFIIAFSFSTTCLVFEQKGILVCCVHVTVEQSCVTLCI